MAAVTIRPADALDWAEYRVTRPLCWLGVHTRGCRGKSNHFPIRGWWRGNGHWRFYG